ncbi:MAG: glycosyltransferase family 4 protein [Ekhidna sp.]|nr:glycosyltransferase family 4 protein [Ekhidna sp.]
MMEKILFISVYFEKGGAEKVFRDTTEICRSQYKVDYFVPTVRLFRVLQLSAKLKKIQPDIIHVHNYHSPSIFIAAFFFKLLKRGKCVVVYTAHDHRIICPDSHYGRYVQGKFIPYSKPPSEWEKVIHNYSNKNSFINITKKLKWFFWYRLIRVQRQMDIILAPSNYLKKQIKQDKIGKRQDVHLLRCPSAFPDYFRVSRPKRKEALQMIFLGRLSFEKGILEFIDLLRNVKLFDYSFDIYGSGKLEQQIKSKIAEHKLDNINVKGAVRPKDIPSVIQRYDVMVLPSIWNENSPLTLIEGALGGLVLLTVNYGGSMEIAQLCGNYHLFNPSDRLQFEEALKACKRSVDEGVGRSEDNRKRIIDTFSSKNYLMNFQSILKQYKMA